MTSFYSTSSLFERAPIWLVRPLDWLVKQPIPMRACLYRHAYLRKYGFYVYDTGDNVVLLIHYSGLMLSQGYVAKNTTRIVQERCIG
jgi:hypothetical protein